jgi:hypothetical protein
MGGNPYGPLTTTNSHKELIMADAHLKRRAPRMDLNDSACVTLRAEPDYATGKLAPAFMPWVQIADIWLQHAGFAPGQPMCFAFDYRNRCLTISPDRR